MTSVTGLTERECWEFLGTDGVGRVVYTLHGAPEVATVNYAVFDGRVWFRTSPASVLARAARNSVVAINVDHVDVATRSGWSVTASGRCRRVDDPPPAIADLLDAWAPGLREEAFALDVARLTGRVLDAKSTAADVVEASTTGRGHRE